MRGLWCTALAAGAAAWSAPAPAVEDAAGAAHAQVPTVIAVRAPGAIALDGKLDDAAWSTAPPASGFRQRDPDEGAPAS
jgi:hypothetical protein